MFRWELQHGHRCGGKISSVLAAETGAQRLGQMLMLGIARGCTVSRVGLGIWEGSEINVADLKAIADQV